MVTPEIKMSDCHWDSPNGAQLRGQLAAYIKTGVFLHVRYEEAIFAITAFVMNIPEKQFPRRYTSL